MSSVRRATCPPASKRGSRWLLIDSHISSGTGRSVRTTVAMSPRRPRIQAATSSTLLIVAESPIRRTWRGRLDDDLLPHRAPRVVVDVVDLVEDDVAHRVEPRGLVVEDVAEDLGGHHHQRRAVVDGVLAGDQADVGRAVALGEVVELLVGERLQRRGVDDPRVAAAQASGGAAGSATSGTRPPASCRCWWAPPPARRGSAPASRSPRAGRGRARRAATPRRPRSPRRSRRRRPGRSRWTPAIIDDGTGSQLGVRGG